MERNQKNKNKHRNKQNDDSLNYYKRIDDILRSSGDEDGNLLNDEFLDNVFSQLEEEAVVVCQSPEISPIIEKLLTKGSARHAQSLIDVLSKDWSSICRHKCSSHVLQKILMVLPKFINQKVMSFDYENEVKDDSVEGSLIRTVLELIRFMTENIEDSVSDAHISHIFRALLQVVGGTCVGEKVLKSRTSRNYGKNFKTDDGEDVAFAKAITFTNYEVPTVFRNHLKKFYKEIFALENFGVYLTDTNGSPVIQTLLLVLHKVDLDLCQRVIHKVIKASRIEDTAESVNIPPVASDSVGSFLVELIVSLSSEKMYKELFKKLFKGKLLQFATHPCANFVLQKLIKNCPDTDTFLAVQEELNECMLDVLTAQYNGVLVALAATCETLQCGQEQFLQMILKCFDSENKDRQEKLVQLLATLTPYDNFMQASEPVLRKVNYHGSLLLQHMLRFSDTQCLTSSLENLEPAELLTLSCDPCGSHVIDTAFQSTSVEEKTKEALLNKFKDHFITLACDKNGSRTLESIWKNVSLKQKILIATCLCIQEDRIRSDRIGFHIHRNFALFHFKKRRKDWVSIQQNDQRRRKMFQDVLDTDEPSKKKKKGMFKKQKT
ncbi:nucleolar protein 9-like [Mercenaria mercenaria]|uniref:nucleolar protein 9-like n=1 Tax=Mercenaria mercenaria TaxID=6596 RepID=UPI00234E8CD7|nr:nucleolar protein 9-like [Mercenaria mercenaria]